MSVPRYPPSSAGRCERGWLSPSRGEHQQTGRAPARPILSNDEIGRIWNAAGDDAFGTIIKLLILTGQRRSEISELRWSEIGADAIQLPSERAKNRRAHVVPLAPTARALLEKSPRNGEGVFKSPAWSTCKDELDQRSGVSSWVIHDIRRSVATGMADIGIAPHIIEAVLNHVSGHKGGVAGFIIVSSYAAEKAAALARWDELVRKSLAWARPILGQKAYAWTQRIAYETRPDGGKGRRW